MPVAEDMQMGMSIGMAMTGKVPVSIFPRMDFMMCCMNQLVNHLDKRLYPGKVIIRTCVGSKTPLDPGVQHKGDYHDGLRAILQNVEVIPLYESRKILPMYQWAYEIKCSSILVEYGDRYASS